MQNHFELFQLPQRFTLDTSALEQAYHEVQNQTHPDRFVNATSAEKRVAMQWTTRANEAYQTLKSPFKRAAYLCELNGVELEVESNTAMPTAFLMQQMEWRDALAEAASLDAVEALSAEVTATRNATLQTLQAQIDDAATVDWRAVAGIVRGLMFVDKFIRDIDRRVDSLE